MKITKTASGKTEVKFSRQDWINIGKKAGWMDVDWCNVPVWRDDSQRGDVWDFSPEAALPISFTPQPGWTQTYLHVKLNGTYDRGRVPTMNDIAEVSYLDGGVGGQHAHDYVMSSPGFDVNTFLQKVNRACLNKEMSA